jgi:aminoglycoside phosphotransferase (APT) family kinase protein
VEFRPIERADDAFQQSVTAEVIQAMCRRVFGSSVRVCSAVELGNGMYNNTYRVEIGEDRPVILRVAPEPARQYRIERHLMRNEYASAPFLAPIASMIPRTFAADFTQDIIGRDYVFQTMLDGVSGPEGIGQYPRSEWASFFRQMGSIARSIHAVRGDRFGPVAGPGFGTWGEAVAAFFADLVADLDEAGLDSADVQEVIAAVDKYQAVLNEVTEPRLLHGDLWTVNVMMAPDAPAPTITGSSTMTERRGGILSPIGPFSWRPRTLARSGMRSGKATGLDRPRPVRLGGRCSIWPNTSVLSAWSGIGWETRTRCRRRTSRCGACSANCRHDSQFRACDQRVSRRKLWAALNTVGWENDVTYGRAAVMIGHAR